MAKKDVLMETTEKTMDKVTTYVNEQAELAEKCFALYQSQAEKATKLWTDTAVTAVADAQKAAKAWMDLGTQVAADARKACEAERQGSHEAVHPRGLRRVRPATWVHRKGRPKSRPFLLPGLAFGRLRPAVPAPTETLRALYGSEGAWHLRYPKGRVAKNPADAGGEGDLEMPETVTIDEALGLIRVVSAGDVLASDLARSLESVLGIVEARGLRKVLVDTREQTSLPSALVLYEFGTRLSDRTRGLKHAVVVSPRSIKDLRVLATVARNRGVQLEFFDCPEAALEWLDG